MTIADGEDLLASDILAIEAIATTALNDATNAQLAADAAQASADGALPLAGGTMLGPLLLVSSPLAALEAATKAYVDTKAPLGGPYLAIGGGVMTGLVLLSGDPVADLGAATKAYVDTHALPLSGGTMTGPIFTLSGTRPLQISGGPVAPSVWPANTTVQISGADAGNNRIVMDAYAGGSVSLQAYQTPGTSANPALNGATAAARNLLQFQLFGFDGTGFQIGGQINVTTTEQWSGTARGTFMSFSTALTGSTVLAERMRIGSDIGALLIGLTVRDGTELLQVSNGIRTPSVRVGTSSGPTITTGAGAPLGSAPVASLFLRSDGTAGQQIYVNTDGTGTGWQTAGQGYLPLAGGTLSGPIFTASGTRPLQIAGGTNAPIQWPTNCTLQVVGADAGQNRLAFDAYGSGAVQVIGRQSPGTAASPFSAGGTATARALLTLQGQGTDGVGYFSGAQIGLTSAEAWSTTARGAVIVFSTVAIGTTTLTERVRVTDAGALQFAATGPSIQVGAGAPAATAPAGSIFIRTDGAAGTRIYINQNGATTWLPIAAV